MKRHFRLNSREQEQPQVQEHLAQSQPLEFASPELMIRHDCLHTPVPPDIEKKLIKSVGPLPATLPWWRRLLRL